MTPAELHERAAALRNIATPMSVALAELGETLGRITAFARELDSAAEVQVLIDAGRAEQPSPASIERTIDAITKKGGGA